MTLENKTLPEILTQIELEIIRDILVSFLRSNTYRVFLSSFHIILSSSITQNKDHDLYYELEKAVETLKLGFTVRELFEPGNKKPTIQ